MLMHAIINKSDSCKLYKMVIDKGNMTTMYNRNNYFSNKNSLYYLHIDKNI